MMINCEGIVNNVVYQNDDNGYCIFELLDEEVNNEFICVGYIPKINIGEYLKITGTKIKHPTYGEQIKIENYEKSSPSTLLGIEKYLQSGVVKGIGQALAKRIVKKFGEQTFDIIEREPHLLAQIKGITKEKAKIIGGVLQEQVELRGTMVELQKYNITSNLALKIYKKYKSQSMIVLRQNPYLLSEEIYGIGFKTVDEIAMKMGMEKDSKERLKAGIKHTLSMQMSKGHVYFPKTLLIHATRDILNCKEELIENQLTELVINRSVVLKKIDNDEKIYLNKFYYAENFVSKKIIELSRNITKLSKNTDKKIKKVESKINIKLAQRQVEAIKQGLSQGVLIITGGPGTGKTTTLKFLITLLEEEGYEIALAAPIGKASKRMAETTNREAKTMHRLLGVAFGDGDKSIQTFDKNEENPIESDVIIIDESSMIDILLMSSFLKAVENGTRLILLGDVDQLPSVGAGNVLKDIINSQVVKVVKLNKIFRQAEESAIITNAHKINKGEYPVLNDNKKDFFFSHKNTPKEIVDELVELVSTRLPKFKNCDPIQDIQVLTPVRKTEIGVNNLNKVLQDKLNPKSTSKKEKVLKNFLFREGDKVMHIKNNYNIQWKILDDGNNKTDGGLGVFNGEEGKIESINKTGETMRVIFNHNKIVDYDFNQLDELDLSYATTIHKSQGSEYKIVVMPMFFVAPMLMSRNLLYTGITRSKELTVLVGLESAMENMISNNKVQLRYTSLKETLISLDNYYKVK